MNDPFDLTEPSAALPETTLSVVPQPSPYLEHLNGSQRQAVEAIDGPLLVLAGAGTGKTRVLTTRLAHILIEGRSGPWNILAVTFTNKAAKEMRERVADLLRRPVEGWWIGTFHAIGARILRSHAEAVGLTPTFTILDSDDQVRLIKQYVEIHEIDDKHWPARTIAATIQRWKDRGLTPARVSINEGSDIAEGKILALYSDYQERLKAINAADFGDLLLLCLELFTRQPEILKHYREKFRCILVDEYQDTNVAQYLWLRLLAQTHNNICCVGDDDQSIYSWRGAEVGNILRFEEDFIGAKVVRLEQNYRSTPHILAAASTLISHNDGRLGKTLWTDINDGEKVGIRKVWDGEAEAWMVSDEVKALQNKGHSLNAMAILVRASFQTREFEDCMIALGLPYRIIGGARFYERQEIRDAIGYLRIVAQPRDDLAFERVVNLPKRGLGPTTMQSIHTLGRAERISLIDAAGRLVKTGELKPKARRTLTNLLADFERWRSLVGLMHHPELAGTILDESGYTAMWKDNRAPEAPGRLDNLKELIVAMEDFEGLKEFLEHVSLVMDNEDTSTEAKVTMMTLHGAKGLEFDTVFLPGWEEGLFPHQRALDDGGLGGLEEERRLAYVGLTRAKQRAIISSAANRRVYGKWQSAHSSRFIDELPHEHIYHFAVPGLQKGQNSKFYGFGEFDNITQTPSWNGRQRRKTQNIEAANLKGQESVSGSNYSVGVRIFHQKFGYGKVVAVEGNKLEIDFEKAGTKKVMDSFVELT